MNENSLKYGNKKSQECTHLLLTTIVQYINESNLSVPNNNKIVALSLLSAFVQNTKNDFDDNIPQLISGVLQLFMDIDEDSRFRNIITYWLV